MVVKITHKKTSPSNENQTLPETTPAKGVKGPGTGDTGPGALTPFIDRISVVLTVPTIQEAYDIHSGIWAQFNDKELFKEGAKSEEFPVGKRIALESLVKHKKWPLLQYKHADHKAEKLRVEFSPVDLGVIGLDQLHAVLTSIVPNGWAYFASYGRVTMIEVTVDVPNVSIDQFHVVPQQVTTAKTWKTNGKLETLVLGKSKSNQTRVYDRGKKRKSNKQHWAGPTTTRVERRMKPQPSFSLAELGTLSNPFASLQLVATQTAPPPKEGKPDYVWELFLDSVTMRGCPSALKLLTKAKRTEYRKWLLKHPVPWWNPDAIWAQWPAVLNELKIAVAENWH